MEVHFYDQVNDECVKFVVIISRYQGHYVWVKHKERDTYEIPGGHREKGEDLLSGAKRELEEETGAVNYTIKPLCFYSVTGKTRVNVSGQISYGMLYVADIVSFQDIHSEIDRREFFDDIPIHLTYPLIQPHFIHWLEGQNKA